MAGQNAYVFGGNTQDQRIVLTTLLFFSPMLLGGIAYCFGGNGFSFGFVLTILNVEIALSLLLGYMLVLRYAAPRQRILVVCPDNLGVLFGHYWVEHQGRRHFISATIAWRILQLVPNEALCEGVAQQSRSFRARINRHGNAFLINGLIQMAPFLVAGVTIFGLSGGYSSNILAVVIYPIIPILPALLAYAIAGIGGTIGWSLYASNRMTHAVMLNDGYLDSSEGRFFLRDGHFSVLLEHTITGAMLTLTRKNTTYVIHGYHLELRQLQLALARYQQAEFGEAYDVPQTLQSIVP